MAGSSSNWYKVAAGPLKGQTVYLSKNQTGPLSRADVLAKLNSGAPGFIGTANQQRPAAAAQRAPVTSWSDAPGGADARVFTPAGDNLAADDAYKLGNDLGEITTDPNYTSLVARHEGSLTLDAADRDVIKRWSGELSGGKYYPALSLAARGLSRDAKLDYRDAKGDTRFASAGEMADQLVGALRKNQLPEAMVTHRAIDLTAVASWKTGDSYQLDGLAASSVDPDWSTNFLKTVTSPAVIVMRLPKGTRGMLVDAAVGTKTAYRHTEGEVLLPPGVKFKVVSVDDGVDLGRGYTGRRIQIEVIP